MRMKWCAWNALLPTTAGTFNVRDFTGSLSIDSYTQLAPISLRFKFFVRILSNFNELHPWQHHISKHGSLQYCSAAATPRTPRPYKILNTTARTLIYSSAACVYATRRGSAAGATASRFFSRAACPHRVESLRTSHFSGSDPPNITGSDTATKL